MTDVQETSILSWTKSVNTLLLESSWNTTGIISVSYIMAD